MIQDSINQMLGTVAIGARLGSEAVTTARNQKFEAAQSEFLNKTQALKNQQEKELAKAAAGKTFGGAMGGTGLDMYENEQGEALANAREAAQKASKRWFFPDKNSMNKYEALERQHSALVNEYEIKRMQAEESWKQQAEQSAKQSDKFKQFVEEVASGYSRHGKGQQLFDRTEQARKLLKEQGGRD